MGTFLSAIVEGSKVSERACVNRLSRVDVLRASNISSKLLEVIKTHFIAVSLDAP